MIVLLGPVVVCVPLLVVQVTVPLGQLFTVICTDEPAQTGSAVLVNVGVGGLVDNVTVAVGESGLLQPLMVHTTE